MGVVVARGAGGGGRRLLRGFLRPLSLFVASYSGIVRINDLRQVQPTFQALLRMSMAGVYLVSAERENEFVNSFKSKPMANAIGFSLEHSCKYLLYVIDDDSSEVNSEMIEVVSIGKDLPMFRKCFE